MKKEKLAKDQDKIILRLPDGMRDRIKAAAARNKMSMNELVVEILEHQFPTPYTLSERIDELVDIVKAFRETINVDETRFLTEKIHETFLDINSGKIPLEDEAAKERVAELLEHWGEEAGDEEAMNELPNYEAGEALARRHSGLPMNLFHILDFDAEAISSLVSALREGNEAQAMKAISSAIEKRKELETKPNETDDDIPL